MAGVRGDVPIDEAQMIASMMVATNPKLAAGMWVDSLIYQAEAAAFDDFF